MRNLLDAHHSFLTISKIKPIIGVSGAVILENIKKFSQPGL